jgi:anaerobic C4-dicarboxylate transporter-like protein
VIWLEFAVVLAAIFVGARVGGIGLGTVAAIGLAVLVFVFGLPPGAPPNQVLGMIVAVVTAAATMQAAGGMDYLVGIATKALQAKPAWITFIAPIIAYFFTFAAGTGHVVYALLPVIAEVSRKAGVRPERPLSISAIASQQAITACPISAATVALIGLLGDKGVTLKHVLMISLPATLLGVIAGALSVAWKGKNLAEDPEYQDRLAKGLVQPPPPTPTLEGKALTQARGSVIVFLCAAVIVVALGLFPVLRPDYEAGGKTKQLDMGQSIMIVMLAAAGLNMLCFGAAAKKTLTGEIMNAGIVALISIAGLAWMGSSFFEGNRTTIVNGISDLIKGHPWIFSIGLFALSVLLFSQAATVSTLMPVGIALGLSPATLVASFPAVNGYFFLPTYGTLLAAISFDQTGTTKIGRYVLNHSFMVPGLVSTVVGLAAGFLLSRVVL